MVKKMLLSLILICFLCGLNVYAMDGDTDEPDDSGLTIISVISVYNI